MIRISRACSLGKCSWNVPLFSQRVVSQPKQLQKLMEFSVFIGNKEEAILNDLQKNVFDKDFKNNKTGALQNCQEEFRYKFLRDTIQGVLSPKSNFSESELTLKEFFDTLPSYKPPEIIQVLKVLEQTGNRPLELIKTICSLLCAQENWRYTFSECSDLLFALAKLSYRDDVLINLISKYLKSQNSPLPDNAAKNILISLGHLKYRDEELIEKLLQFNISKNTSINSLLNCLKAVTYLNYSSPRVEELIKVLSEYKDVDFMRRIDYIDFIWSCVVLNKVHCISPDHLSRALTPKFITGSSPFEMNNSHKWKLLNINAFAQRLPSYKGHLLNESAQYKIISLSVPKVSNTFLESVHDALTHIVPHTGYIKSLVNTGAGFNLDLEYSMDSSAQESEKQSVKKGIMLLNYKDICSDGTPTGMAAFKFNILKGRKYEVTVLRYTEYNIADPLANKISLLKKKMNVKAEKVNG